MPAAPVPGRQGLAINWYVEDILLNLHLFPSKLTRWKISVPSPWFIVFRRSGHPRNSVSGGTLMCSVSFSSYRAQSDHAKTIPCF